MGGNCIAGVSSATKQNCDTALANAGRSAVGNSKAALGSLPPPATPELNRCQAILNQSRRFSDLNPQD